MPATLGVKLGAPDRPVVGLIGDGSSLYAIQALWTAAHYNIPATYVIINNYRYDTLRLVWGFERGREPQYEDISYYVDLDNPRIDFVKMAESYGLRGTRVTKPEELSSAIKAAQKSGEPSLIDVGVQIAQW
jgi:benzoylformate decarboxylase